MNAQLLQLILALILALQSPNIPASLQQQGVTLVQQIIAAEQTTTTTQATTETTPIDTDTQVAPEQISDTATSNSDTSTSTDDDASSTPTLAITFLQGSAHDNGGSSNPNAGTFSQQFTTNIPATVMANLVPQNNSTSSAQEIPATLTGNFVASWSDLSASTSYQAIYTATADGQSIQITGPGINAPW